MPRIAVLAFLLLSGVARAERIPTIAVVGIHQDRLTPTDQRRAAAAIAQTVDESGFFAGITLTDLELRLQGREDLVLREAFLGPGRQLLQDGRLLYNQAQFSDAVPVLIDAVHTLTLAMPTTTSTRELWDALVYQGAAHQSLGEGRDAREAFARAVALNPLRTPDPALFPPDLIERYEAIRRERVALASTVTVHADEAGTRIWLNGVEQGVAPITMRNVVPGDNHLHARSPNGFFAYEALDVVEAGEERVSLRLGEPTLGYPAGSRYARQRQVGSLYGALGEHLDTDLVLLAGTVDDLLVLQLYSTQSAGFSEPLEVGYSGSAADEAVSAIPELLVGVREDGTFLPDYRAPLAVPLDVGTNSMLARSLVVPREISLAEGNDRRGPTWLAWTAIGLGGAAVIAGGVFGLRYAFQDPNQGTIVVGPVE